MRATHSDTASSIGIGILGGGVGIGFILWFAAVAVAWLTGASAPTASLDGVVDLFADPADPATAFGAAGLHPVAYWIGVLVLLVAAAGLTVAGWRLFGGAAVAPIDVRRLPGTATRGDVARTASAGALQRRGSALRPSLASPRARDLGYLLGRSRGESVWASVEDSLLVLGPPRSGKGAHLVINAILDAPGAVVTTSTRPDNLAVTMASRAARGPVHVFDPQRLAPGAAAGSRWSPIRGCVDPTTAMIRATGFAAATGFGGVEGGDFWQGKTRVAIQCLLHAAALDDRSPADLYQWTLSTAAARDAARILGASAGAAPGWADALQGTLDSDPRTRDSVWHGVSLAFSSLADPRVLEAVSPQAGEEFDPASFLESNGTLYLLATGAGASASSALVSALVEDLVEVARRRAAASARTRLDPPLLLALDEIGNLAPLPSLPTLMAEGGGSGITVMPVLQSLAQARHRWGEHNAAAIWDASIVKVILGGGSSPRDLQDLSHLLGERDESTISTTVDARGDRSSQISPRKVPVMTPETIRTFPFGTGLVLLRTTRPMVVDLRFWGDRRDGTRLRADEASFAASVSR